METATRDILATEFGGLTEQELLSLYHFAAVRKLNTGDCLIRENTTEQTVYVVLDGEIKIVQESGGQKRTVALLGQGSWVGEIAFSKAIPRNVSAVVAKPASVLAINTATFNALSEKIQLVILKKMNDMASDYVMELLENNRKLALKNEKMTRYVFSIQSRDTGEYDTSEIIQGILAKVPKLPLFASVLSIKLLQDTITPKEVADLVQQDPSLVGIVLKTINSPFYGFKTEISDIHRAIIMLGYNRLYQLVLSEGVRRIMPDTPNFHDLHCSSVAISQIAFVLAKALQLPNPVQIATLGLLHELGDIVTHLLKEQNPKMAVLIDVMDRAKIGSMLLKKWNIPQVIWKSVEYHRYPEFTTPAHIPDDVRPNVAALYITRMCHAVIQGKKEAALPTIFIDDYKTLMKCQSLSMTDIIHKRVLPGVMKDLESSPAFFREMIKTYLAAHQSRAIQEGSVIQSSAP